MSEKLTHENQLKAEADVIRLSGVPDECIQKKNVKVGEFDGEDVHIRTIIINTS